MNYNQRLKQTQRIELFAILILIIFASSLVLQFQDNCKERRGNHSVVKAPSTSTLKTTSLILSNQ